MNCNLRFVFERAVSLLSARSESLIGLRDLGNLANFDRLLVPGEHDHA